MGTKTTAVISCFGLLGIIIALIAGEKSDEARYYVKQSGNAIICSVIASVIIGILSVFLGDGILSKLLTILLNLYEVILFIEILVSAITLNKKEILGLYRFIK